VTLSPLTSPLAVKAVVPIASASPYVFERLSAVTVTAFAVIFRSAPTNVRS
jgi:hypothetical protein